jgi:hypothetical protein
MAAFQSKEQVVARKQQIISWLTSEAMKSQVRWHRNGGGFSVSARVRFNVDGQQMAATDYLKAQGFADGDVVGDYRLRINPARDQFAENYTFFILTPVVSVPVF